MPLLREILLPGRLETGEWPGWPTYAGYFARTWLRRVHTRGKTPRPIVPPS